MPNLQTTEDERPWDGGLKWVRVSDRDDVGTDVDAGKAIGHVYCCGIVFESTGEVCYYRIADPSMRPERQHQPAALTPTRFRSLFGRPNASSRLSAWLQTHSAETRTRPFVIPMTRLSRLSQRGADVDQVLSTRSSNSPAFKSRCATTSG